MANTPTPSARETCLTTLTVRLDYVAIGIGISVGPCRARDRDLEAMPNDFSAVVTMCPSQIIRRVQQSTACLFRSTWFFQRA